MCTRMSASLCKIVSVDVYESANYNIGLSASADVNAPVIVSAYNSFGSGVSAVYCVHVRVAMLSCHNLNVRAFICVSVSVSVNKCDDVSETGSVTLFVRSCACMSVCVILSSLLSIRMSGCIYVLRLF